MKPTTAGQMLLDTFETVRIINLAHRKDRREEVLAQLAILGLTLDNAQVEIFPARSFSESAGFPTTGTRGCFESHLAILEEALGRGSQSVLILEDDVNLVDRIEEALPTACNALSGRPWSIFYGGMLGWNPPRSTDRPISVALANEPIMATHFIALRAGAIARAVPFLRAIAARAPGDPAGGPMHVDGAYTWLRRHHPDLTTMVAVPVLGYQRSSRTDVHSLRFYDRIPGFSHLVSLYRRARNRRGGAQKIGKLT